MNDARDNTGKTAAERFAAIREYFLACLNFCGHSRTELYHRPKPGDLREPTEEELVRRWAETISVPLNDILIGIKRAFEEAPDRGHVVTSFRYCVPHIVKRAHEMKYSRVGSLQTGRGA